uniref:Uncharacterized protein n=1 Tax=uncultured marine group II/III euryarchaeote KM3_83_G03 TaxID=1456522 RepID=A0A075HXZ5_9EURY|nr:hypothetical protein [uncultured marine group II/III euryarchaeote KM3_83_G03]
MGRFFTDAVFVSAVVFLIVAIGINNPVIGSAVELPVVFEQASEVNIPHILMVTPHSDGVLMGPSQTFLYRVKAIDYEANCQLYVDDQPVGDVAVVGEDQLARVKANLNPGYYAWRVECKLLNSRTISSLEKRFSVEKFTKIERSNPITGNVVARVKDPELYKSSLVLTMLTIASLVWIFNWKGKE